MWLGKPRLYTFMASTVLTLIEHKLSDIGVKRFGQAVAVCVQCTVQISGTIYVSVV